MFSGGALGVGKGVPPPGSGNWKRLSLSELEPWFCSSIWTFLLHLEAIEPTPARGRHIGGPHCQGLPRPHGL